MQHAIDSALSEMWQRMASRKKQLRNIPKPLHKKVEAFIEAALRHENTITGSGQAGLVDAGYANPAAPTAECLTVLDLEQGRFGSGSGALVFNVAYAGTPGARKWRQVNEAEWSQFIRTEMTDRSHYVTGDRHHKDAKPGLWNLYARLAPWIAEVAGEKFESMGDEGRSVLEGIVIDLARELSRELKVEVVGLAIHREKSSDLHCHFIFSETIEVPVPKKRSKREFEALLSAIARKKIDEGDKRGFKALRRVLKKDLRDEAFEIVWERQRKRFPRPVRILGPSFSGKMALWEASGRNPKLAALGDRPLGEANTFRARVSQPLERGEDLGETHIDVWLERAFREAVEGTFTSQEIERSRELGKAAAIRYMATGSQTPSLEQYVAKEVEKMAVNLPESIKSEIAELEKRERAVALRERAVDAGLPEWLMKLLEDLPKRYRRPDPQKSLQCLCSAAKKFAGILNEVNAITQKVSTMKIADWVAGFGKIRQLLVGLSKDEPQFK